MLALLAGDVAERTPLERHELRLVIAADEDETSDRPPDGSGQDLVRVRLLDHLGTESRVSDLAPFLVNGAGERTVPPGGGRRRGSSPPA